MHGLENHWYLKFILWQGQPTGFGSWKDFGFCTCTTDLWTILELYNSVQFRIIGYNSKMIKLIIERCQNLSPELYQNGQGTKPQDLNLMILMSYRLYQIQGLGLCWFPWRYYYSPGLERYHPFCDIRAPSQLYGHDYLMFHHIYNMHMDCHKFSSHIVWVQWESNWGSFCDWDSAWVSVHSQSIHSNLLEWYQSILDVELVPFRNGRIDQLVRSSILSPKSYYIHTCDICAPWLTHMCDTTHWHMWHDS